MRVDRALGDDEPPAGELGALLGVRGSTTAGVLAQRSRTCGEEIVLEAVVERDDRRRAHDDERLGTVDRQLVEHAGSGSKSAR